MTIFFFSIFFFLFSPFAAFSGEAVAASAAGAVAKSSIAAAASAADAKAADVDVKKALGAGATKSSVDDEAAKGATKPAAAGGIKERGETAAKKETQTAQKPQQTQTTDSSKEASATAGTLKEGAKAAQQQAAAEAADGGSTQADLSDDKKAGATAETGGDASANKAADVAEGEREGEGEENIIPLPERGAATKTEGRAKFVREPSNKVTAMTAAAQDAPFQCLDYFESKYERGFIEFQVGGGSSCEEDLICFSFSNIVRNRCENNKLIRFYCDSSSKTAHSSQILPCENGCEPGSGKCRR